MRALTIADAGKQAGQITDRADVIQFEFEALTKIEDSHRPASLSHTTRRGNEVAIDGHDVPRKKPSGLFPGFRIGRQELADIIPFCIIRQARIVHREQALPGGQAGPLSRDAAVWLHGLLRIRGLRRCWLCLLGRGRAKVMRNLHLQMLDGRTASCRDESLNGDKCSQEDGRHSGAYPRKTLHHLFSPPKSVPERPGPEACSLPSTLWAACAKPITWLFGHAQATRSAGLRTRAAGRPSAGAA